MNELLDILMEARLNESLPEPQQKFYKFVSKLGKEWIDREIIAKNQYFFWILSDGSVVASGSGGGMHHFDGARIAGTSMEDMMKSGAIRGTFMDAVGAEVDKGVLITREQVRSVQYLVKETGEKLIIDIVDTESEADEYETWYQIERPISTDLLYRILNGNGKVKEFRRKMEDID